MRLLVLLCVVAVLGGAQAGLQETWQDLVDSLQGLGQHALDKLNEAAGHLSNGALDKLIAALANKDSKRDLQATWQDLIASLQGLGQHALDKLNETAGNLSNGALDKLIAALANKDAKRALDLTPHADKLKDLLSKYTDQIKGIIETIKAHPAVGGIKEVIKNLMNLVGVTKREVNLVARGAVKDLVEKYVQKLKELLKDMIKPEQEMRLRRDLGQTITDFFKPHINTINDLVQQIGSATTDHATNLWQNLQDSAKDLGDKLSGHVDKLKEHGQTLVGHGQDAVNALKDSVTDILNSTFQNMVGTIKDSIDTGKDAISTVGEHIDGAVNAQ